MQGKFQIYKSDYYYFRLKSNEGEIILYSEGYTSLSGCRNGIESVKMNSSYDSKYEKRNSANFKYYFLLKAGNGEIIGRSEMYNLKNVRDNALNLVKKLAKSAIIEDLT